MTSESQIVGESQPEEEPICKTIAQFARYIGRSESTVKRLIAEGVVIALHDGRSVTIPVRKNTQRYLDYLKAREKQHRTEKRSVEGVRSPEQQPEQPAAYSELGARVMATGDFIVDDMKPKTVPERSCESAE